MTTATVYADLADDWLQCSDTVYATARSGAGTIGGLDSATLFRLVTGQYFSSPSYLCIEAFISFDTAFVGDGDVITVATIGLYGKNDASIASDFNLYVSQYDWGATVTTADFRPGGSEAGISSFNTSAFTTAGYNTLPSNAAMCAAINRTGFSRYSTLSDRVFFNNVPTGFEYVAVWSADQAGTANDPKLDITYNVAPDTLVDGGLINGGLVK